MRWIAIFLFLLTASPGGAAGMMQHSAGAGLGAGNLLGGRPPWFTISPNFQIQMETRLKSHWHLSLTYSSGKNYDDSSAHANFKFGSDKNLRTRSYVSHDLILLFKNRRDLIGEKLSLVGGIGGGISVWAFKDKNGRYTLRTEGERGDTVDFAATEIIVASSAGLEYLLSKQWRISLETRISYLTGAGAEFTEEIEDARPPWKMGLTLSLNYLFSGESRHRTRETIRETGPKQEGIIEPENKLPIIEPKPVPVPISIPLAANGIDSDGDGVPDEQDLCPKTEMAARQKVDINGCPIDTDCDGIPDYQDKCPQNAIGAVVDKYGCPIDGDQDGVPDGLDDCPESDSGLPVDRLGCLDTRIFDKPTTLPVRYHPGSFELDQKAMAKLDTLALALKKAVVIKVEINGYADDFDNASENNSLSQRRASRVRDYLSAKGIDGGRMNPKGRGSRSQSSVGNSNGYLILQFSR